MEELLGFNAFGLIVIESNKLKATLTSVAGAQSITRTVSNEDLAIKGISDGGIVLLTFAAYLQKGKSRVTVHEIGGSESQQIMLDNPVIQQTVEDVIDLVKKKVGIE